MALSKKKAKQELEKKMLIRRTVTAMNRQIAALEDQKRVFLEKARVAHRAGLEAQVNLALTGYKMTLLQQKRAQEMLLNFEITSQMKDMSMMTQEFLGGMSVLSREMAKLCDEREFMKVQQQFEEAMGKASQQAEQMDMFMEASQDSFASAQGSTASIDDSEIRSLLDGDAAGVSDADGSVDDEIADLRRQIDAGLS